MDTFWANLTEIITDHTPQLLRALLIILLAWVVIRLVIILQNRLEKRIIGQSIDTKKEARLKTLGSAGTGSLEVIIIGAAMMMILRNFGIDIKPILASAGVAGLAISLGAQTLIKDYLSGALILFEGIFDISDVVEINGTLGTIEQIDLRTTQMRDVSGRLYTIPNGEIRTVANTSRGWSRAIVDINLALHADLEQGIHTLQTAIQQAAASEALKPLLLETPQIVGWNNMTEWGVQVRIMAKTHPGKQYEAAVILRKASLNALQSVGVELAPPVIVPNRPLP